MCVFLMVYSQLFHSISNNINKNHYIYHKNNYLHLTHFLIHTNIKNPRIFSLYLMLFKYLPL